MKRIAMCMVMLLVMACEEDPIEWDAFGETEELAEEAYRTGLSDESELTVTLESCDDESEEDKGEGEADETPCIWVKATIIIGTFTYVEKVRLCGPRAFVTVPNIPELIGLPITVVLPGGRTMCGTAEI